MSYSNVVMYEVDLHCSGGRIFGFEMKEMPHSQELELVSSHGS